MICQIVAFTIWPFIWSQGQLCCALIWYGMWGLSGKLRTIWCRSLGLLAHAYFFFHFTMKIIRMCQRLSSLSALSLCTVWPVLLLCFNSLCYCSAHVAYSDGRVPSPQMDRLTRLWAITADALATGSTMVDLEASLLTLCWPAVGVGPSIVELPITTAAVLYVLVRDPVRRAGRVFEGSDGVLKHRRCDRPNGVYHFLAVPGIFPFTIESIILFMSDLC